MNNKETNFELNLLPVISLLAVLISFLLLTTVWVQIGTLDVKQAMGDSPQESKEEKRATVWINFEDSGTITMVVKNADSKDKKIELKKSDFQWQSLESALLQAKADHPDLAMGFVQPSLKTPYQNVIRAVESLKNQQVLDVGISPIL